MSEQTGNIYQKLAKVRKQVEVIRKTKAATATSMSPKMKFSQKSRFLWTSITCHWFPVFSLELQG